jgi:hypothetical protein
MVRLLVICGVLARHEQLKCTHVPLLIIEIMFKHSGFSKDR